MLIWNLLLISFLINLLLVNITQLFLVMIAHLLLFMVAELFLLMIIELLRCLFKTLILLLLKFIITIEFFLLNIFISFAYIHLFFLLTRHIDFLFIWNYITLLFLSDITLLYLFNFFDLLFILIIFNFTDIFPLSLDLIIFNLLNNFILTTTGILNISCHFTYFSLWFDLLTLNSFLFTFAINLLFTFVTNFNPLPHQIKIPIHLVVSKTLKKWLNLSFTLKLNELKSLLLRNLNHLYLFLWLVISQYHKLFSIVIDSDHKIRITQFSYLNQLYWVR